MSPVTDILINLLAAIGPAPRRYPIVYRKGLLGHETNYGPWRIYFDPPPIPTRSCDWHFFHEDFDGADDAFDNRCGSCASFAEALNECDLVEDDNAETLARIALPLSDSLTNGGSSNV